MFQRYIAEIGKSQRLEVINRLKRSQGLSVGELAKALGMSYMGIKQHCVDLEKRGYLYTWRDPRIGPQAGRPKLLYRLTPRALALFPSTSNESTRRLLESARDLYGSAAPEKLLYQMFQRKTEDYQAKVKGDTLAKRVASFAALRDAEGCMAEADHDGHYWYITEHHTLIGDLLEAYPTLLPRLEQVMFGQVLGRPVVREPKGIMGLYCCAFRVE